MMTVDEALGYAGLPADSLTDAGKNEVARTLASEVRRLRDEVNGLTGSLDRAEKALKEAQEQEPVLCHAAFSNGDGTYSYDYVKWPLRPHEKPVHPVDRFFYARPVPAAPAVAVNISHNVDAKADSAERIEDNSAAPTVAVPAVQDDCVSQDESTMMMAASALALYRAGESAEYMAKAIEAMLQSAPQAPAVPDDIIPDGDDFNGTTPHMIKCIESLVAMNDRGILVPHGLCGHSRTLLLASANRLRQQAAPAVPTDEQIHVAYREALGQSIRERDMPEIRKFAHALLQSTGEKK